MSVATVNPYANHDQLSPLEQDVLWEYAKLGDKLKRISNLARLTAENPNEALLAELRTLEKKMGLVLTLIGDDAWLITQFKASVWGVMQDQEAAQEEALQAELARKQQEEQEQSVREASYGQDRWDDSM